jgi:hypothetical protein
MILKTATWGAQKRKRLGWWQSSHLPIQHKTLSSSLRISNDDWKLGYYPKLDWNAAQW